jgi:uncharacterized protein (TIGR02145 family)
MEYIMIREKISLLTAIFIAMIFIFSCTSSDDADLPPPQSSSSIGIIPSSSSGEDSTNDSLTDARDGQKYKTVTIGSQTWIAKNLNYNAGGSVCYNGQDSYCATYGRLYNWATAMALPTNCNSASCFSQLNTKHKGVCPEGWHVPSEEEWDVLFTSVGGISTAGKHLKATVGWNSNGNGQDSYGFAALPGGTRVIDQNSSNVGNSGIWWSTSESSSTLAYRRRMLYDSEAVDRNNSNKGNANSIRCVKD